MKYIVTINNNNYEVEVEQGTARLVKTSEVAEVPVVARSVTAADVPSSTPVPTAAKAADGESIKAPMPGTILKVLKVAGDKIKQGEVLFIMEAMKMENEIMAPHDGVMIQVIATKGATVETGDLLAVIQG